MMITFVELLFKYETNLLFFIYYFLLNISILVGDIIIDKNNDCTRLKDIALFILCCIMFQFLKISFSILGRKSYLHKFRLEKFHSYSSSLLKNINGLHFAMKNNKIEIYNNNFKKYIENSECIQKNHSFNFPLNNQIYKGFDDQLKNNKLAFEGSKSLTKFNLERDSSRDKILEENDKDFLKKSRSLFIQKKIKNKDKTKYENRKENINKEININKIENVGLTSNSKNEDSFKLKNIEKKFNFNLENNFNLKDNKKILQEKNTILNDCPQILKKIKSKIIETEKSESSEKAKNKIIEFKNKNEEDLILNIDKDFNKKIIQNKLSMIFDGTKIVDNADSTNEHDCLDKNSKFYFTQIKPFNINPYFAFLNSENYYEILQNIRNNFDPNNLKNSSKSDKNDADLSNSKIKYEKNDIFNKTNEVQNFNLLGDFILEEDKKFFQIYFFKHSEYIDLIDFLIYDLSAIKEAEKAEITLKSKFFAKIAHEFKTPLNSIIGLIKNLNVNFNSNELEKRELKNTLNQIENLSNYVIFLINDVIDYSKMNQIKKTEFQINVDNPEFLNLNLKYENVNLKKISSFCYDITRTLLINKGKEDYITVENDFDENINNFEILSDEFRLKQILLNFLSNSVKFTRSGLIKIKSELISQNENTNIDICNSSSINNNFSSPKAVNALCSKKYEMRKSSKENITKDQVKNIQKIKISIIDSGIGIKEEELKTLLTFKDNNMLSSAINYNQEGSGLGLSITNFIIEKLSHTINVSSTYGKGSCFSIFLNAKQKTNLQDIINQSSLSLKFNDKIYSKKYLPTKKKLNSWKEKNNIKELKSLFFDETKSFDGSSLNNNNFFYNCKNNFDKNYFLNNNSSRLKKNSYTIYNYTSKRNLILLNENTENTSHKNIYKRYFNDEDSLSAFSKNDDRSKTTKYKNSIYLERKIISDEFQSDFDEYENSEFPFKQNFKKNLNNNFNKNVSDFNNQKDIEKFYKNEGKNMDFKTTNILDDNEINKLLCFDNLYQQIQDLNNNNNNKNSASKSKEKNNIEKKNNNYYSFKKKPKSKQVNFNSQEELNNYLNSQIVDTNYTADNKSFKYIKEILNNRNIDKCFFKYDKKAAFSTKNINSNDIFNKSSIINGINAPYKNNGYCLESNGSSDSSSLKFYVDLKQNNKNAYMNKTKKKIKNMNSREDQRKIIFIIDDHKFVRESLKNLINKILEKKDLNNFYRIKEASDGSDIIKELIKDQFNNNKIKCIITDENMDFINGSEPVKVLKDLEKNKKIKPMPIASISANEDELLKKLIKDVGVDHFLPKPCNQNNLLKFFDEFKIFEDENN